MFGKIYDSTYWGEGVNNSISWGEVYREYVGIVINRIESTWNSLIETWNSI